jgi:A/G-specific adenine glycosylase
VDLIEPFPVGAVGQAVTDDLVGSVLEWGITNLRDLPWRTTRDPWAVLVAEVMLQQTQVARVLPKYAAFLAAFPEPAACAGASLGDVLTLWSGLGYPRRARNLQLAAAAIGGRFGGTFPSTLDELLQLPGVGAYTARALLVFAFERPVAVVDTNIARMLARLSGRHLTTMTAQQAADRLVPVDAGWVWNQVLMDLGATVCRPIPRCVDCPAAPWCAWHRADPPLPDPAIGSAGVSTTQPRFHGSDRQARGRLIATLVDGPIAAEGAAAAMAVDHHRADRLVKALIAEGLVVHRPVPAAGTRQGVLRLP